MGPRDAPTPHTQRASWSALCVEASSFVWQAVGIRRWLSRSIERWLILTSSCSSIQICLPYSILSSLSRVRPNEPGCIPACQRSFHTVVAKLPFFQLARSKTVITAWSMIRTWSIARFTSTCSLLRNHRIPILLKYLSSSQAFVLYRKVPFKLAITYSLRKLVTR